MRPVTDEAGLPVVSTFSIVAFDPQTGELGIAVESKFLGVGAVVPWAQAGVGAIATQSWANTSYGPQGLAYLAQGLSAQETLDRLTAADAHAPKRQAGIVDAKGQAATFTGNECMDWAGGRTGSNYACQGNILVSQETVAAMAQTFEASAGSGQPLPERLVAALLAGQQAGGDSRGQQSAALLVVKEGGGYAGFNDRYIDLRVEDHPTPIEELQRLMELHRVYFSENAPSRTQIMDEATTRQVQTKLATLGFYHGQPSGQYDEATRTALRDFSHKENLEERWNDDPTSNAVDTVILQFVQQAK